MTPLPPIKVTQGEPFAYTATVQGQNWTGYTGVLTVKTRPQDTESLLAGVVTGDALGALTFDLTGAETALLPARSVIGYRVTCVFEIVMTNGTDTQTFQGRVAVAGVI